jgi:HEXXH motif-containing protein
MAGSVPAEPWSPHRMTWSDFDLIARSGGGARLVRQLRAAERSRRLLLIRNLVDELSKEPQLLAPLPPAESAWELILRVDQKAPSVVDDILAHPYTGSWVGYTTRLWPGRTPGVCPLWVHLGHLHSLSAAAAIRANLEFATAVPSWHGKTHFPTLGTVWFANPEAHSTAHVRRACGKTEVRHRDEVVRLPASPDADGPGWWALRRIPLSPESDSPTVTLDDLDPYRGLYEPASPRRLDNAEAASWARQLPEAWRAIRRCLPETAEAIAAGLRSVVPAPRVPFRLPSASTGEAFGSAVISQPETPDALAAALVHEFQHIRLGGLLHLVRLHEPDPRERYYAPWRNDPRPIGGLLQGIYAFAGITEFYRELHRLEPGNQLAAFEFALWRTQTTRAATSVSNDSALTTAGRRFVSGVTEKLLECLIEPVSASCMAAADRSAADHHAGWRIRHIRPDPATVAGLAAAWTDGRARSRWIPLPDATTPTPVPDGAWSEARSDLVRLVLGAGARTAALRWRLVPEATAADYAYATGRSDDAVTGYLAQLREDPDRPSAWVGLGLALALSGSSPAVRALLHRPELVRAVHRKLRRPDGSAPPPEQLAEWIGRFTH